MDFMLEEINKLLNQIKEITQNTEILNYLEKINYYLDLIEAALFNSDDDDNENKIFLLKINDIINENEEILHHINQALILIYQEVNKKSLTKNF